MSITLTNAYSVSQGASVIETDPQAAAMTIAIDFSPVSVTASGPIVVMTFRSGNVSGVSLAPGTVAGSPVSLSINLTTGAWAATTGQSGVLSGLALTSLLTTLKGLRNSAETFAVTQNIVAGTQVSW